ncbi:MAG: methyltransferase family protein [Planctomycetaceae bacterium]|nr:methyltransferase family protein [Planctomycetaceae bacterium]
MHPEWMDEVDLDVATHQAALKALSRINTWSLSDRILWPSIRELARAQPTETIRVLDVACGGGDVTLRLASAAQRSGMKIQVDGCDLSETALAVASQRASQIRSSSQFFKFDALRDTWPSSYDVICCSLFLHHLSAESAEHWLRNAAQATKKMVLVSDLVRNRWGYFLACVFSRLLTRSPVVHFDAPVSVTGAFTLNELRDLAARAGLQQARVSRRWPARMLLQWSKS